MYRQFVHGMIIGCVDNASARKDIARVVGDEIDGELFWIDAGNGQQFGQVLVGNTTHLERLRGSFNPVLNTVERIPAPSLQDPYLLVPETVPVAPADCAEEVRDDGQSPVINQAMATLVLNVVHQLLTGTLTYMAAYLDLEKGSLRTVPVDPETVSRMTGIPEKDLMNEPQACSRGMFLSREMARGTPMEDLLEIEEGGEA